MSRRLYVAPRLVEVASLLMLTRTLQVSGTGDTLGDFDQ
jgi:hypothetical protein